MKFLISLLSLITIAGMAQGTDQAKPTTIFLVRHAEKANDGTNDPPLSEEGKIRAAKLAEVLKNSGVTAIYSTNYKRTRTTVEPIAKTFGLEVRLYEAQKEPELKRLVDENKGGVVVICGHSNSTPWSANFLAGTKLDSFNEAEYGNILIITFWDFGKAYLTRVNY